jgi:2,4-dichlorophenol 6-monooxygenase
VLVRDAARELPARTPVLVIGGGPVGLVVSGLLSQRGVAHVLVERRREPRAAPAAHVLRRRSMEILVGLGVADEVQHTAPRLPLDFITWCATLGGVEVGRLNLRPRDSQTRARAPEPWTHCPQNVLEAILRQHATARAEARVSFGAECTQLTQTAAAVSARIRWDDGEERRIEARFVIAADGAGSPTRRALGIPMEGAGPLGRFFMVHFAADLAPWFRGRAGPIFWLMRPEASGCLIVHDPERSHVFMTPRRGEPGEEDALEGRLVAALGVPVAPKIFSVDEWSPHVQVAARFRAGRVLLVGDAAHRFPPTGGLGLNTGIQEAHALVARLARVLTGGTSETSLATYEAECRGVALANAAESFENMKRLGEVSRVVGACADLAALERRIASLTEPERRALDAAIEAQRSHFVSDGASLAPPAACSLDSVPCDGS